MKCCKKIGNQILVAARKGKRTRIAPEEQPEIPQWCDEGPQSTIRVKVKEGTSIEDTFHSIGRPE